MDDYYTRGLLALKDCLSTEALGEFNDQESRLKDNLRRERRFGSTETTRAERAAILSVLNELAQKYCDMSFTELCERALTSKVTPSSVEASAPVQRNTEYTSKRRSQEHSTPFPEPAAKIEVANVSAPVAQTHHSTGITKPSRMSAFISYSHKDKKYLDELHIHLAQYKRMGVVDFWDDTKITPGSKWHDEIKKALQLAKVAVLLVSADFLASDFIAIDELPPLLVAAEQEGAIILPVILRPCALKDTNLAQFQAVNAPSNPLSKMTRGKREEVWTKVAELIKDTLNIQS